MYRVARNPAAGARGPAGAAAHFFAPPLCGVWWCLFVFPLLSFARPTSLHRLCAECGGAFLFALSYPLCGPLLCTAFVRSVVVPFCLPSLILCAAHFFAPPVRGVWWCLAVCLVPCCVYVLDSRRRRRAHGAIFSDLPGLALSYALQYLHPFSSSSLLPPPLAGFTDPCDGFIDPCEVNATCSSVNINPCEGPH